MTHQFLSCTILCQPCLLGAVTLAIHFDPQCLTCLAIPSCQYCIRHVTYCDPMLFKCWPAVFDVRPALKQHWVNVSCLLGSAPVFNSRPNTATLTKCWASVVDGVPALKQRWLHVIVQPPPGIKTTLGQRLVFAGKCTCH